MKLGGRHKRQLHQGKAFSVIVIYFKFHEDSFAALVSGPSAGDSRVKWRTLHSWKLDFHDERFTDRDYDNVQQRNIHPRLSDIALFWATVAWTLHRKQTRTLWLLLERHCMYLKIQKKNILIHNSNRKVIIMYRCVPNVTLLTLFCYLSPNSVSSKQRVFTQLCEKKAQLHLHLNSAALLLLRYI